jgi:hypothetical protein
MGVILTVERRDGSKQVIKMGNQVTLNKEGKPYPRKDLKQIMRNNMDELAREIGGNQYRTHMYRIE